MCVFSSFLRFCVSGQCLKCQCIDEIPNKLMQKLSVVFNFCIENPCISLYHETFPPVGWSEHRAKWNILVQLDFSDEREKKGNECLCLFVSKGLANANKFKTHIFLNVFHWFLPRYSQRKRDSILEWCLKKSD